VQRRCDNVPGVCQPCSPLTAGGTLSSRLPSTHDAVNSAWLVVAGLLLSELSTGRPTMTGLAEDGSCELLDPSPAGGGAALAFPNTQIAVTRAGVNVAGGCLVEWPTGRSSLRSPDDAPCQQLGPPSAGCRAALLRPLAQLTLNCTQV